MLNFNETTMFGVPTKLEAVVHDTKRLLSNTRCSSYLYDA